MTIDDAIEQERKQAEMYRCEYEGDCDYYGKDFIDDYADELDCIKNMNEHEQLAEWLEELKILRENANGYNKEDIELNRKAMYNKAIDDFVTEIKTIQDQDEPLYNILWDEVAEQLKAGVTK